MSIFGGLTNSGQGNGFQAATTPILQPATVAQANDLQNQSQFDINQQQNFLNALANQGGVSNQSSVFNQLQGVANGTGPNPAQAQLAQATGANTANQAALMAGQRGAGANVGLIARQAAQQGGANQQNAAGQAATMQANQSLNALNQLGGLATQQVNQNQNAITGLNQATQGEQNAILGSIGQQNNANVGMQSSINKANSDIAGINAGKQDGLLGGALGGLGTAGLMAATGGLSAAIPAAQKVASNASQSQLGANTNYGGLGSMASMGFGATGGVVGEHQIGNNPVATADNATAKPKDSHAGLEFLKGILAMPKHMESTMATPYAHGGTAQPMKPMPTDKPMQNMKSGGHVAGKPKVSGAKNTLKNDTVPAVLSPGEIVLPRSVTQSSDPVTAAAHFVHAVMAKRGSSLPSRSSK